VVTAHPGRRQGQAAGIDREGAHMKTAIAIVHRFVRRDEAQDLLEYGLLAVLIAVVAYAAVGTLGDAIYSVFWVRIAQIV
jgi:Flp pilus assembly pilin Flp